MNSFSFVATIYQYLQLALLLIRYGKLRNSGFDINERKTSNLQSIDHTSLLTGIKRPSQKWGRLWKNLYTRNLIVQVAFVKSSITTKGGHLSARSLKLNYIRIPKAASTSAAKMMLQAQFPELMRPLSTTQINDLADVHLEVTLPPQHQQYTYFTIVRNPFARLVSVYKDFFENSSQYFLYTDYLFGVLKKDMTFHDFVKRISIIPDRLKDQHLKPQHRFLEYYRKQNIPVKILKLEDQAGIASFLSGYQLQLPLENNREAYDPALYYDLVTLEIASKMFKTDLKLFNYENFYWDLKEKISLRPHA